MLVFYFFAAVLIFLSVLSLRGGWRFLAYVKQELAKPKSDFAPFVSVIAPCRGLDDGLRENLTMLYKQDYPAYEIVFVVDDANDRAAAEIEAAWRGVATETKSKLVVAGRAVRNGQKVHNLLRAIEEVEPRSEVFVFVDSDARPGAGWLRSLVAPLENEDVGAATGYRWFVGGRRSFGSELRSVWNASIASALGADAGKNFCWGGATAIRRETFERVGLREHWRGAVSDDFAATDAMRANDLQIRFVPQCLTASIGDSTVAETIEFTTRQMIITRVYAAHLWRASLVGSLLFTATFWTGVFLTVWLWLSNQSFWLPLAALILIFLLGTAKAWLRLAAVKLVLTDYRTELNRSSAFQLTLWTITPLLYLYNATVAAFSRKIVWRGIAYKLESPTKTVVINR